MSDGPAAGGAGPVLCRSSGRACVLGAIASVVVVVPGALLGMGATVLRGP